MVRAEESPAKYRGLDMSIYESEMPAFILAQLGMLPARPTLYLQAGR